MGPVPLYYLRYLVFTNSIRDAKANTLRCGKSETEFVRVAQHTTFWYAHPTTTNIPGNTPGNYPLGNTPGNYTIIAIIDERMRK